MAMGNLMDNAILERERERVKNLPQQIFLELDGKQIQARFSGRKTENRAYVFMKGIH